MAAQPRDKMKQTLLVVYVVLSLVFITMIVGEGLRGEIVSTVRTPRPTTEFTLPLETATPRHQHTEIASATPTPTSAATATPLPTATEELDD